MSEVFSDRQEIMIVENDDHVRMVLGLELGKLYTVREACDGSEALEMIRQRMPDLVVADIMMPEMDGLELCRLIKENDETFHIPVILLTARKSDSHQVEGFTSGADTYVTKPFSYEVLKARIHNLLESRHRMRSIYGNNAAEISRKEKVLSVDDLFLQQAVEAVEAHLEDEAFSTDDFARAMKMSSRSLSRKIRAVVGEPPMIFVRTLRLRKAHELLLARAGTVSEIAWKVGFSESSYFSKCFKEQYGLTASECMEQSNSDRR